MEANEKQEQAEQTAIENVPETMEPAEENTAEATATFESFGFSAELMQGLSEAGFTEPTPIQVKAIPEIMAGHDIIGQALTGTGKTAAFGLPVMNKLQGGNGLRFLVLVPTRELAAQVSAELYRLGRFAGIRTAAFTGGQSYTRQEKMLRQGIDILVATPGRLIDLMDSGVFKEVNPEYVVVDEADEMLDMGFIDDVRKIFEGFPGPRQTMLFSATMPKPVVELAEKILHEPVNISTTDAREIANNDIEQIFHVIEEPERTDAIIRLIDAQQNIEKAIVFCRTREEADALNILLNGRGYNVNCIHGDMEQAQRTRVMSAFRRGEFDILVATDVAARGLDVGDVTHVFNFHLPFDPRGYVHRIGRTGRMGRAGTAITLVTPREMRQLEAIRRQVGAQMENRPIPTRTEVTSLRLKKIFQELHDYELDMDILNQVKTLAVNQDLLVIIAKLLGHQFSGGADQGPEHIGIDGERLDNILSRRKGRKDRDRRDRGGDRSWKRDGREDRPWKRRHEESADGDDRSWRREESEDRSWKRRHEESADGDDRSWRREENEDRPWKRRHEEGADDGDRPWMNRENAAEQRDAEAVASVRPVDETGAVATPPRPPVWEEDAPSVAPVEREDALDSQGMDESYGHQERSFHRHDDGKWGKGERHRSGGYPRRDGDRPFKRGFDRDGDRPFKRGFERDGDRPVRRGFDRDGDRPVRRGFDRDGDRPVRRGFDRDGDRPVRRGFDRDGARPFERDGARPVRRDFDRDSDQRANWGSFRDGLGKPARSKFRRDDAPRSGGRDKDDRGDNRRKHSDGGKSWYLT